MGLFNEFIAAGVNLAFAAFVGTDGAVLGASSTAPAQGAAGSGGFQVRGMKTAAVQLPEPDVVLATGDDTGQGTFIFPSETPYSFQVVRSVFDLAQIAAFSGTKVHTLNNELSYVGLRTDSDVYPDFAWILQSQAKRKNQGAGSGLGVWSIMVLPLTTISTSGRSGFEERAAASELLTVTAQPATSMPYGTTFTKLANGYTSAPAVMMTNDYPIHFKRFTGTGALTTFNLDYTPISTSQTLVFVKQTAGYYAVTVSSVNAANKTFTLATAPAANAEIVAFYGFAL